MRILFLGNHQVDYSSETHHANTLEQLGHTVHRLQETEATAQTIEHYGYKSDLFVWVHTHGWHTIGDMARTIANLRSAGVPSISYHLDRWLGLQRQAEIGTDVVFQVDHWFTCDQQQADWLNAHTNTIAHYLPAGVYEPECYLALPEPNQPPVDVIFVGSKGYHPEYPYRPKLVDWLADTYFGFEHWGGDGKGTIRGDALNKLYTQSKVVVGDSLRLDGDDGSYWSDRVFETLGRGGFLIHPHLTGLAELFKDREHLVFYQHGDLDELKWLIDYYLYNGVERENIRQRGHWHVKTHHTYTQRWQHILETLNLS